MPGTLTHRTPRPAPVDSKAGKPVKADKYRVLSDEDRSALEARCAAATNPVLTIWLTARLTRDDNHRRNRDRDRALLGDGSQSGVFTASDERGFTGAGSGRMATVLPPVEYRGTTKQVAGL